MKEHNIYFHKQKQLQGALLQINLVIACTWKRTQTTVSPLLHVFICLVVSWCLLLLSSCNLSQTMFGGKAVTRWGTLSVFMSVKIHPPIHCVVSVLFFCSFLYSATFHSFIKWFLIDSKRSKERCPCVLYLIIPVLLEKMYRQSRKCQMVRPATMEGRFLFLLLLI